MIIWDPIRQVWVDAKTKGVVTVSSNTVTQPQGSQVASYTQQGRTRPQRASAKEFFPLVIPDLDWWKTCDRDNSDLLTTMTTKCDIFKDIVNCQQLASMGYLPSGIQSFVPHSLHGGFTIPNGCSSGNLGVEYDGLKMVFNSPQVPIMAVIAKDVISKVFYFGSGVTQVSVTNVVVVVVAEQRVCVLCVHLLHSPSLIPCYLQPSGLESSRIYCWCLESGNASEPPHTVLAWWQSLHSASKLGAERPACCSYCRASCSSCWPRRLSFVMRHPAYLLCTSARLPHTAQACSPDQPPGTSSRQHSWQHPSQTTLHPSSGVTQR